MGRPSAALAALGLLAIGVAGCAHEKVAVDGYRWAFLRDTGEAPRLAYGRPSSDDVVLMIRCISAGQVHMSTLGVSGREIVLASGRAESRFPAAPAENAMAETSLLEAVGEVRAPALAGFRRSGDLSVLMGDKQYDVAATSEDRSDVKAFFEACRA